MSADPLTAGFDLANTVVRLIFPDPQQQADALLKVEQLHQNGDLAVLNVQLQTALGQLDINKVEAASPNVWNSGWRPFIGWICGTVIALAYIPYTIMATILWSLLVYKGIMAATHLESYILPPKPEIGLADIIMLLTSLLGMAGLRTYEKYQGIDTKAAAPAADTGGLVGAFKRIVGR